MAEHGPFDMEQLRLEAQNRWLRPAEICEILRNHKTFQISTEPSLRPPSGSFFLFDRRAVRYFRKDGHNWRKKNKGNTVKEAHEKLKVGNVKMLHCYYAHGEENENFQRRSYSMLELDLMHIVFVHYLKVKNNDTNIGCIREIDEATTNFPVGSPSSSCPSTNYNKMPSENTESTSQPFLKVVAEKSHQASSGFHSNLGLPQMDNGPLMDKMDSGLISSCFQCPCSDNHDGPLSSTPGALFRGDKCQDGDGSTSIIDSNELHLLSWKELLDYGEANFQSLPFHPKNSSTQSAASGTSLEAENFTQDQLLAITNSVEEFIGSPSPIQTTNGQVPKSYSINDTNITSIREIYEDIANFLVGSPLSSFSPTDHNRVPSENTDSMSPPFLKSVAEENHQESSSLHSKLGCLQIDNGPLMDKMDAVLISAQFQWHNSDIEQLLLEALHRWLRPAEICVLLRNYHKFRMSLEPANRPSSGSLFLFDRKMLRYFRKDGHKWRKKKDGKTVKEAHEKLKVGSVDVLHCYHAHGEENENFQRRSYWMLEEDMMHIVIVHYLEVKCNRTNVGGNRETDEVTSSIQMGSPFAFSFPANHTKAPSGNTDSTSPRSTLMPSCEDAVYLEFFPENHEDRSSIPGVDHVSHVHGDRARDGDDGNLVIESQRTLGLGSREEVLEQFTLDYDNVSSCASMTSIPQPANTGIILHQQSMIEGMLLAGDNAVKEKLGGPLPIQSNFQIPFEDNSLDLPKWHMDPSSNLEMSYNLGTRLFEQGTNDAYLQNAPEPFSTCFDQQNLQALQNNLQIQLTDVESQCVKKVYSKDHMHVEGNINYTDSVKQTLLDENEGLKKVDSFSVWASKELGELDNLHMQSSSGVPWSTVEGGNVANHSSLSPSLSQVQLYSIIDFSPKWAYRDSETESQQEVEKCNWACMFGEVEVPAEPVADGILCCHAPPHNVGQVPFYVTCSNGLACSDVREFGYEVGSRTVLRSSGSRNIPFGFSGLSNDFLSFCHSCNKELEGKAIYMYSGEKAFCSEDCRMKQILIDKEIQSTKLPKNAPKSDDGRELVATGILVAA